LFAYTRAPILQNEDINLMCILINIIQIIACRY
jgi:hypothetical protein